MYFVPHPLSAEILVSAAVRVVLPWSTCPIVPTFTCGLFRSNFALAIALQGPPVRVSRQAWGWRVLPRKDRHHQGTGALIRIRTGDLVLTKNALCQLSYEGPR